MPHKPRRESSTRFYHIYVRGINKEKIFGQPREKNYFKRIIRKYLKEYDVEIYSYCIMSNHAHLLIKSDLKELSMFMSKVLAKYAQYYGKSTHNRRERPVHGHRGRSRGPFYYRITTFGEGPWDARDPHKTTFMTLK